MTGSLMVASATQLKGDLKPFPNKVKSSRDRVGGLGRGLIFQETSWICNPIASSHRVSHTTLDVAILLYNLISFRFSIWIYHSWEHCRIRVVRVSHHLVKSNQTFQIA